jgi:hypothetical protein
VVDDVSWYGLCHQVSESNIAADFVKYATLSKFREHYRFAVKLDAIFSHRLECCPRIRHRLMEEVGAIQRISNRVKVTRPEDDARNQLLLDCFACLKVAWM